MDVGAFIAGRFEIERLAGQGGMGAVYRAHDRSTGRPVALKVLAPGMGGAMADARFVLESRILAELRHPAIVQYVDHGVHDGRVYLAMEWLEGVDLDDRLAAGPLGVAESVAMVERVASALAMAHQRGVVHRDLKPSNVFLVGGLLTDVRVVDFGIARRGDLVRMTATGAVVGTPGYMAPEQARGDTDIDARADVYALGCVLFECLAGRPLFEGASFMAILAKVLLEGVPRIRELRKDVSEPLDELLTQMLARDRDDRPRDGAELALRLDRLPQLEVRGPESGGAAVSTARMSLSADERRLLSLIIVAPPVFDAVSDTELDVPRSSQRVPLVSTLESLGGRLEVLANRSTLVTVNESGSATDQAVRAACIALALREASDSLPIVLATGALDRTRHGSGGEVIERAVGMLAGAAPRTITSSRPRVAIRGSSPTRSSRPGKTSSSPRPHRSSPC